MERKKVTGHERNVLNRGRLRDLILLCSFASALVCGVGNGEIVLGFTIFVFGCFLHVVAKGTLIRYVVLTNRGPYGLVRHPYYFANYLIDSSFCILSGNHCLLMAYPFLFFWAYGPTVRYEERLLSERHGDAFLNDSFVIPQIFPDRASLRGLGKLFEGFSVKRITAKECSRVARLSAVGLAITLVQELKPEGLSGLKHLWIPTEQHYHEFIFMLATTALFLSSLLVAKFRNQLSATELPDRQFQK